jgi:hypothetical protein
LIKLEVYAARTCRMERGVWSYDRGRGGGDGLSVVLEEDNNKDHCEPSTVAISAV